MQRKRLVVVVVVVDDAIHAAAGNRRGFFWWVLVLDLFTFSQGLANGHRVSCDSGCIVRPQEKIKVKQRTQKSGAGGMAICSLRGIYLCWVRPGESRVGCQRLRLVTCRDAALGGGESEGEGEGEEVK